MSNPLINEFSPSRRPLFVTHVTRDDLLLGYLAQHQRLMTAQGGAVDGPRDWAGAMVLSTGASKGFPVLPISPHLSPSLPLSRVHRRLQGLP